jgi:hypothetical protein
MLRAYIDFVDFRRTMRMVVVKDVLSEPGRVTTGRGEGQAIVPTGNGMYELRPLKEGERIKPEDVFLELPQFEAHEFLQSLVVALAQHGFITPDKSATELREADKHLETLVVENSRKHALLLKLVDFVTTATPLPAVLESTRRTRDD